MTTIYTVVHTSDVAFLALLISLCHLTANAGSSIYLCVCPLPFVCWGRTYYGSTQGQEKQPDQTKEDINHFTHTLFCILFSCKVSEPLQLRAVGSPKRCNALFDAAFQAYYFGSSNK